MTATDLSEYLTVIQAAGLARASLEFAEPSGEVVKLALEFVPAVMPPNADFTAPTAPGGWKEPQLDNAGIFSPSEDDVP